MDKGAGLTESTQCVGEQLKEEKYAVLRNVNRNAGVLWYSENKWLRKEENMEFINVFIKYERFKVRIEKLKEGCQEKNKLEQ